MTGTCFAPLSLCSPTKTCDLPLRATGSQKALELWTEACDEGGTKVPSAHPSSCPFHWLWGELSSPSGTSGTWEMVKITDSNQFLRQPLRGRRRWEWAVRTTSPLVLNSPCSCVGPFCSPPPRGQLHEWGGRLPAAIQELDQLLSHHPHVSRPASASLPRHSPPFSLPRVPNGLIFLSD